VETSGIRAASRSSRMGGGRPIRGSGRSGGPADRWSRRRWQRHRSTVPPIRPLRPSPRSPAGQDLHRPNVITLVRLACIPLFLWLLFGAERQTAAPSSCLPRRHRLDRRIRRPSLHQVSTVGKVLDRWRPVLVVTAVIAIIVHGAVPVWFGVATLAARWWCPGVLLLASLGRPGSMCSGWARRGRSP